VPGFTDVASAKESAAYRAIMSSKREMLESTVAALPGSVALAFGRLQPEGGYAHDKVNRNSFAGYKDGTSIVVLTASMLNHSCWCNACQQMMECKPGGYAMRIYANCDIAADEEITISYVETLPLLPERMAHLRNTYGFDCLCPACIRPDVGAQLENVSTLFDEFTKAAEKSKRLHQLGSLGSLKPAWLTETQYENILRPAWLTETEHENILRGKEVLRMLRACSKGIDFMTCAIVCTDLASLLAIVRPQNWVAEASGFLHELRAFEALTYGSFEHADLSEVDRDLAALEEYRVAPPPPQDAATVLAALFQNSGTPS
jgi:hypothetical protein